MKKEFDFLTTLEFFEEEYVKPRRTDSELAKLVGCSVVTISKHRRMLEIKPNLGHNLLGETFGDLTVIQESGRNRWGQIMWLCECKCGNRKVIHGRNLECGDTKTCGCSFLMKGEKRKNWKGHKDIPGSYWCHVLLGAKKRELPVEISLEHVYEILKNQEFKCELSNLQIGFHDNSASLDRIDSTRGYVKSNIMWLHKDVNCMKWDFDLNYFLDLCYLVQRENCSLPIINVEEFAKNVNWKGHGNISSKRWGAIKRSASSVRRGKNRNLEFSVTIEKAWAKFLDQNGRCGMSDMPLKFNKSMKDYSTATASLDRIDSNKGYVDSNVWWIHKDINKMKWKFNLNYFVDLCRKIVCHKKHEIKNLDIYLKENNG